MGQIRNAAALALFGLLAISASLGLRSAAVAQVRLPTGFTDSVYESGFSDRLTAMAWAPDGRLFVSEKTGALRVVKNRQLLAQPFMRLAVGTHSERGLLGIAFDPRFSSNRFVYAYYTNAATTRNRVSRFTASSTNPDVVQAGSERVLLDNIPSEAGFHNGGALHFGPDGKLYVAVGDSGNSANAPNLSSLAGKILRINPDGSVPSDNPFVGQAGRRSEIWAYGLRNPYTFAFQPGTSRMFINDVGNNSWEEINRGARGANFGWPTCEGPCDRPGLTDPIYAYSHASGPGKAITGAAFYNGGRFPSEYADDYFFADYVGGYIKHYDLATGRVGDFATGVPSPVDLRVGPDGALYYLSVEAKFVGRISFGGTPQPTPSPTSTPREVGQPPVATIESPPAGLTYRAGDRISFSGSARDPEDGTLPVTRLTWEVVFHHDTHTHPYVEPLRGTAGGSFTIATAGEPSANTWYRVHLRATDSVGNTTEKVRDIRPRTSRVTIATQPSGLTILLDGTPVTAPRTFLGVERYERRLTAPRTQTLGGRTYEFVSWSNGRAAEHMLATPTDDATVTATYRQVSGGGGIIGADDFGQSVAQGWGQADTGGPWSLRGGAAQFAVAKGSGQMMMRRRGASAGALLTRVSARDVDVRVRIRVLKRPIGGPVYAYLVVRGTDGHEYRPKLVFQPDGTVAVHAGLVVNGVERPMGSAVTVATSYPVRQFFWLRARVSGANPTRIDIRAWRGGQAEPDAWQLTLTDSHGPLQGSGFLGLRANLSSRASNAPATVEFDDLRALPPG